MFDWFVLPVRLIVCNIVHGWLFLPQQYRASCLLLWILLSKRFDYYECFCGWILQQFYRLISRKRVPGRILLPELVDYYSCVVPCWIVLQQYGVEQSAGCVFVGLLLPCGSVVVEFVRQWQLLPEYHIIVVMHCRIILSRRLHFNFSQMSCRSILPCKILGTSELPFWMVLQCHGTLKFQQTVPFGFILS
jgi:hypothetical protein